MLGSRLLLVEDSIDLFGTWHTNVRTATRAGAVLAIPKQQAW